MTVTEDQIVNALEPVQDPELRRSIVELGMVHNVVVDGVNLNIHLHHREQALGRPWPHHLRQHMLHNSVAVDSVNSTPAFLTADIGEEGRC